MVKAQMCPPRVLPKMTERMPTRNTSSLAPDENRPHDQLTSHRMSEPVMIFGDCRHFTASPVTVSSFHPPRRPGEARTTTSWPHTESQDAGNVTLYPRDTAEVKSATRLRAQGMPSLSSSRSVNVDQKHIFQCQSTSHDSQLPEDWNQPGMMLPYWPGDGTGTTTPISTRETTPDARNLVHGEAASNGLGFSGSGPIYKRNKRRRAEALDDNNGDASEWEGGGSLYEDELSKHKEENRSKYACPYFRKDPICNFQCLSIKLSRFRDIRQHIERRHRQEQRYCPTCYSNFTQQLDFDDHIRSRNCNPRPPADFLNSRAEDKLRVPTSRSSNPRDQWNELWTLLFPHLRSPNNPFLGTAIEETVGILRDFVRDERAEIVSDFLRRRPEPVVYDVKGLGSLLVGLFDEVHARFERRIQERTPVVSTRETEVVLPASVNKTKRWKVAQEGQVKASQSPLTRSLDKDSKAIPSPVPQSAGKCPAGPHISQLRNHQEGSNDCYRQQLDTGFTHSTTLMANNLSSLGLEDRLAFTQIDPTLAGVVEMGSTLSPWDPEESSFQLDISHYDLGYHISAEDVTKEAGAWARP